MGLGCGSQNVLFIPAALAKARNLLEMQILRPSSRLAGIRNIKSEAQQSVFQQGLQVILLHIEVQEPLALTGVFWQQTYCESSAPVLTGGPKEAEPTISALGSSGAQCLLPSLLFI